MQMVDVLLRCKESGAVSVKAEFEAEGTRIDELLRLVDLVKKANLKLGIKIGGCEAIKDLMEVKQIGTDYVIAPMIESDYALKKFIDSKNKIFDEYERNNCDFLINIETIQSLKNLEKIIEVNNSYKKHGITGIVFGRVDFVGSLNLDRKSVDSPETMNMVLEVANLCKEKSLDFLVGGAVSIDSINSIKAVADVHLTRFETRKVVFSGESAKIKDIEKGLLNAVHFELLWLLNKREYYGRIFQEDEKRIEMLENRWKVLNTDLK
jgi:citrate lyase beta subunit